MNFRKCLALVLFIFISWVGCEGQTVEASIPVEVNGMLQVKFIISDLPTQTEAAMFNGAPYYRAFVNFGDGNFKRIGSRANPVYEGYSFTHRYPNLTARYPFELMLESRKDTDDPPESPVKPTGPNTDSIGYLDLYQMPSAQSSLKVTTVNTNSDDSHIPSHPMISDNLKRVKIGLSQHHSGEIDSFYFLQEKAIHALPISYRSNGPGKLFLFYRSDYDGINYDSNNKSVVPNYYSFLSQNVNISNKRNAIAMSPSIPSYLETNVGNSLSGTGFDRVVVHDIDEVESGVLNQLQTSFPTGAFTQRELKLTHYFKGNLHFPNPTDDAQFIAILYDKISSDKEAVDSIFNVDSISINKFFVDGDILYQFSDYDVINAKKGEPNDPGGLIIENIRKINDNYNLVDFKLTFCNDSFALIHATRADAYLYHLKDSIGDNILSDISLTSDCVLVENSTLIGDCDIDDDCTRSRITSEGAHDELFCYEFSQNSLTNTTNFGLDPAECGYITFTAKIKTSNLNLLKTQNVLKYCVKFNDAIDAGPFCRPNDILKDSVCVKIEKIVECESNPIWDNRNTPVCKIYYWCFVCLVLLCLILFIFYRRRHMR